MFTTRFDSTRRSLFHTRSSSYKVKNISIIVNLPSFKQTQTTRLETEGEGIEGTRHATIWSVRFDRRKRRGKTKRRGGRSGRRRSGAGGRWLDRKDVRFSTCVGRRSSRPARRKTAPGTDPHRFETGSHTTRRDTLRKGSIGGDLRTIKANRWEVSTSSKSYLRIKDYGNRGKSSDFCEVCGNSLARVFASRARDFDDRSRYRLSGGVSWMRWGGFENYKRMEYNNCRGGCSGCIFVLLFLISIDN